MEKPRYEEGQEVEFDLGGVPNTKGRGKIRGLAFQHFIDGWIVEVESSTGIDKTTYPWSCIVVNHPMLKAAQSPAVYDRRPPWEACPDLYECQECSSNPGSPQLCERCLRSRAQAREAWRGSRNFPENPR